MQIQKIKAIAKAKGIKAGNLKKPELIHAIQLVEGNFDCYGTAILGVCEQTNCVWREDCLECSINKVH
ncbi:MAG: SAP domain-containing protein [Nitrospirae bacterium]|nr:SAP domain-containing protein [Nitrospirota bacterium]